MLTSTHTSTTAALIGGSILQMHPQPSGARLILEDEQHRVFMFSPVNDQLTPLPGFEGALDSLLWDTTDPNVFIACDGNYMFEYVYAPVTATGPKLELLCKVGHAAC